MHLSDVGFLFLGDLFYGKCFVLIVLRVVGETLARQALHAAVLGFVHLFMGEILRFEALLFVDFVVAVEAIRLF